MDQGLIIKKKKKIAKKIKIISSKRKEQKLI
jgi:hypothetical protein